MKNVLLALFIIISLKANAIEVYLYSPNQTTSIQTGDSVTFSIGADDPIGLDFSEWYIGSTFITNHNLTGYYDEDTYSRTFNSAGNFTIYAYVYNTNGESDFVWWNIKVEEPPCADLIVDRIWSVPENPVVGEAVDLYADIKNIGEGTATSTVNLSYYVNGTFIGNDSFTRDLVTNDSEDEFLNDYIFNSAGTYTYIVDIDQSGQECSTSNNSRQINITVQEPPIGTLNLTSPTGGENWLPDSTHDITWNKNGNASTMDIKYSIDGGPWQWINNPPYPSAERYSWTLPSGVNSNQCKVALVWYYEGQEDFVESNYFTIAPPPIGTLSLTSPTGGENWLPGSTHDITWNKNGNASTMDIKYSIDGGPWQWINNPPYPSAERYSWTLPSGVNSNQCKVALVWYYEGQEDFVESNYFTIQETQQSTIEFAGLTWRVTSGNNINPGSNNWSNSTNSVWVDSEGALHLNIRKIDDIWYSSQIESLESFGYGEYKFYVSSNVENFDQNTVVGLYTFYKNDELGRNDEIDIEFSQWGDNNETKRGYYVVQSETQDDLRKNIFPLNLNGDYSTHRFVWKPNEIEFQSWHGHNPEPTSETNILQDSSSWIYNGDNIPKPSTEKVLINFWLDNGQPPSNGEEAELIIKNVEIKPLNNQYPIEFHLTDLATNRQYPGNIRIDVFDETYSTRIWNDNTSPGVPLVYNTAPVGILPIEMWDEYNSPHEFWGARNIVVDGPKNEFIDREAPFETGLHLPYKKEEYAFNQSGDVAHYYSTSEPAGIGSTIFIPVVVENHSYTKNVQASVYVNNDQSYTTTTLTEPVKSIPGNGGTEIFIFEYSIPDTYADGTNLYIDVKIEAEYNGEFLMVDSYNGWEEFKVTTALPQVTDHFPDVNATGVPITTPIEVHFNMDMDQASVEDPNNWKLYDGTNYIPGTIEYSVDYKYALYYPENNLDFNKTYTVTLNTTIQNTNNISLDDYSFSFTTQSDIPGVQLEVPFYYQSKTNWCWAASTSMLLEYYGFENIDPSLKTKFWNIAADLGKDNENGGLEFTEDDDLQNYLEDNFNNEHTDAWYGKSILFLFDNFNVIKNTWFYNKIINSINNNNPVMLILGDNTSHAVVITGYDNEGVYVHDPSGVFNFLNPNKDERKLMYSKFSWINFFSKVLSEGYGYRSLFYAKPNKLIPNYTNYTVQLIDGEITETNYNDNNVITNINFDGDENHQLGYLYEPSVFNPDNAGGNFEIERKFSKSEKINFEKFIYFSKYTSAQSQIKFEIKFKNFQTNEYKDIQINTTPVPVEGQGSPSNINHELSLPIVDLSDFDEGNYIASISLLNEDNILQDQFELYFEVLHSSYAKFETTLISPQVIEIPIGSEGEWEFEIKNIGTNDDKFNMLVSPTDSYFDSSSNFGLITSVLSAQSINNFQHIKIKYGAPSSIVGDTGEVKCTIHSDNDDTTIKDIKFEYVIVDPDREIEVIPNNGLFFEDVFLNLSKIDSVKVKSIGLSSLHISDISISGNDADQFILNSTGYQVIKSRDSIYIPIQFKPASEGTKTAKLIIVNDSENLPNIEIDLHGSSLSGDVLLAVEPDNNILFDEIVLTESQEKILTVSNPSNSNLELTKLEITGVHADQFDILNKDPQTILSGESYEIRIQFNPIEVGAKTASLDISNNSDNASPVKTVQLSGIGIDSSPPDEDNDNVPDTIDQCPNTPEGTTVDEFGCPIGGSSTVMVTKPVTSMDLGEVHLNTNIDSLVTIKNTGSLDLNISNINIVGADTEEFTLINFTAPQIIASGDSIQFLVRISPTSVGQKTAALEIANDSDNASPIKIIQLAVIGIDPATHDEDEDGVYDDVDQCQGTPLGETVDSNGCSDSQLYTAIPDSNFEQALIDLNIDSDRIINQRVATSDISGVTRLNVENKNIEDLTGIEGFMSLTNLYCSNNQLKNLDLSNNPTLIALRCNSNLINDLDLSKNRNLILLECMNNQITSLNLVQNTSLVNLYCSGNKLKSLNVKNGNNALLQNVVANYNFLNCIVVDNEVDANTGVGYYTSWVIDDFTLYAESDCPDIILEKDLLATGISNFVSYQIRDIIRDSGYNIHDADMSVINATTLEGKESLALFNMDQTWDGNQLLSSVQVNDIVNYVQNGGSLYLSSRKGYENLLLQLGVTVSGNDGGDSGTDWSLQGLIATQLINHELTQGVNSIVGHIGASFVVDNNWTVVGKANDETDLLATRNLGSGKVVLWYGQLSYRDDIAWSLPSHILLGSNIQFYNNLFSFLSNSGTIQTTAIPDANFEQALIDLAIDSDGIINGQVLTADINPITYLDVSSKSIEDLTGIEDFISLTELHAQNNQLTNLNVTKNTSLSKLNCNINELTSLDVSQNILLVDFQCFSNNLTNLDVSKNILLETLVCHNNQIGILDVSQNTALLDLICGNNLLSELDISQNVLLRALRCEYNQITSLDASQNPSLSYFFYCYANQLTSLNLKNGNNSLLTNDSFNIADNPDLQCVEVDNVSWSNANWTNIDVQTSFNEDCNSGDYFISEFFDLNDNLVPADWTFNTIRSADISNGRINAYTNDGGATMIKEGQVSPNTKEIVLEMDSYIAYSYWGLIYYFKISNDDKSLIFLTGEEDYDHPAGNIANIVYFNDGTVNSIIHESLSPTITGVYHFKLIMNKLGYRFIGTDPEGNESFNIFFEPTVYFDFTEVTKLEFSVQAHTENHGWIDNISVTTLEDDDNDGVYNDMDQCPNTPVGAVVDEFGCKIEAICDNLKLTIGTYNETEDLNQKVIDEFGASFGIADWNDIKNNSDLESLAACMNLKHDQTFMVTMGGKFFQSGNRQYYVHYSTDGTPYAGFAAHDQIGNFYLGSWYGITMNILAKNTSESIMLTQYYEGVSDSKWIEIKNISGGVLDPNDQKYFLALYDNSTSTSTSPTQFVEIPLMQKDEVLLFRNSDLTTEPDISHIGNATKITSSVCNFDGNDILLISTTNDATCFSNRVDIIGNQTLWGENKSFIRGGNSEAPSIDFNINDWIELSLAEEVNLALTNTNIALGTQDIGLSKWNGNWNNTTIPDRTRNVEIPPSFDLQLNSNLETLNLAIHSDVTLDNNSSNNIIVHGDLTIAGSLTIGDTESLVMYDDNATVSGAIVKKENSSSRNNTHDFTYWSSPVSDATVSGAFPDVSPSRIYYHDQSQTTASDVNDDPEGTFWNVWIQALQSDTMVPARGYAAEGIAGTTGVHEVVFNGAPNNGLIEIDAFHNTDVVEDIDNDFNFIGNPYPSAINIDEFFEANTSVIYPTAYLWTHNTEVSSGGDYIATDYATYNLSGGVGVGGAPKPSSNFASGQGFFVRSKMNGKIKFLNNIRLEGDNHQFYKNENSKAEDEKDRIWLNLSTDQGGSSQILINFAKEAKDGFDMDYDALKFDSSNFINFYSTIDSSKLVIQGLSPGGMNAPILLGFDTQVYPRTFSINILDIEGELINSDILLKDNLLNLVHDLKVSNYHFLQEEPGEFLNRFELLFSGIALNIDDDSIKNEFIISNNFSDLKIISSQIVSSIKVYNLLGQLLIKTNPYKKEFSLETKVYKTGSILLIQAILEDGTKIERKTVQY